MTRNARKPRSLRLKFVLMLVIALSAAVLLGWLTEVLGEAAIDNIYMSDEAQEKRAEALLDDFEEYVRSVNLSVRQGKEISRWAKHQNRVNLEISDGYEIVVDSSWWDDNDYYSVFEFENEAEVYTDEDGNLGITDIEPLTPDPDLVEDGMEPVIEEEAFTRKIRFSDGVYYVTVYEISEMPLYSTVTIASYAVAIAVFMALMLLYHQRIIKQIIKLSREVESIAHGNLDGQVTVKRTDAGGAGGMERQQRPHHPYEPRYPHAPDRAAGLFGAAGRGRVQPG